MDSEIVITGMGIISSEGIGKFNFSQGLYSSTRKLSQFRTSEGEEFLYVGIDEFNLQPFLGETRTRGLDRPSILGICATKLALEDAGIDGDLLRRMGYIGGNAFGSLSSITEFTKTIIAKGPMATKPLSFQNVVMNSPASRVNIHYGLNAFSATITNGYTSSVDALAYGVNRLKNGDEECVCVGCVEDVNEDILKGFKVSGCLAKESSIVAPFDKNSNGVYLGEAAVVFILEKITHAMSRNAKVLAKVNGFGMCFDTQSYNGYGTESMEYAMSDAIKNSKTTKTDVDLLVLNANGNPRLDKREAMAIKNIFEDKLPSMYSVKGVYGDSYGASGAVSIAAGIVSMDYNAVPPNKSFSSCWLSEMDKSVPTICLEKSINSILVNSFDPAGNCSCVVISRFS